MENKELLIINLFHNYKYQEIIKMANDVIDYSIKCNYYIIFSMIIELDIYQALSFINKSSLIKDNLEKLLEGGANYSSIALLSNSKENYDLAKLLFIYNFVNSVFKEEINNDVKDRRSYYYIRLNEMINNLYEASCNLDLISEVTNDGDLLLSYKL